MSARHGQAKCNCCIPAYASVWKLTPGSAIDWVFDTGSNINAMAVDGSGNMYFTSSWSSTYSANLFKIDSSGALVWAAQVGASSSSTTAIHYDGSQLIVNGSDGGTPNKRLYYVSTGDGSTTSSYAPQIGADYISSFRGFASGTPGLFCAYTRTVVGGTGGGGLSAGTVSQFDLGTNSCDAVCIDPFTTDSVLFGRNATPDVGILAMTASTLHVHTAAAGANSSTVRLVPDVSLGAGSEIVWAVGVSGIRKVTNGTTLVPDWRVGGIGIYDCYPDGLGAVFVAGRSGGSYTVAQYSNGGAFVWGWDGLGASGNGQTGIYYDGTSVFTGGPRNNTYSTTV